MGGIALRLIGVGIAIWMVRAIYQKDKLDADDPTFSFYWKGSARSAIQAIGAIFLLYYILESGPIRIDGFGVVIGSAFLLVFVTGETIIEHREETYDAIDSMPIPPFLKIAVGISGLVLASGVLAYVVLH